MVCLKNIRRYMHEKLQKFRSSFGADFFSRMLYYALLPVTTLTLFFLAIYQVLKEMMKGNLNAQKDKAMETRSKNHAVFDFNEMNPVSHNALAATGVKRERKQMASAYYFQGDVYSEEEKELTLTEEIELSRQEYEEDRALRELIAGLEGIGSMAFSSGTNIPPSNMAPNKSKPQLPASPLQEKMKERKVEENQMYQEKKFDVEGLRAKLLAPRQAGGASRAMKFE